VIYTDLHAWVLDIWAASSVDDVGKVQIISEILWVVVNTNRHLSAVMNHISGHPKETVRV